MGRLDDKVVLITGGARGQGASEARLCAAEGATVWLTDVLDDEGKAVAAEIGGVYRHHDVRSAEEWAGVVDELVADAGRVDGLVNNAGVFEVNGVLDCPEDAYRRVIDINQVGVFLGMQTVGRAMVAAGAGGSMVNISSVAGMRGSGMAFAYGASKFAVRGMTKSAAQELGPHQIRVNSVHPGLIQTDMVDQFAAEGTETRAAMMQRIPLGRFAGPEEVADLVLFLLSDDSVYCSGQEFVIDGAFTA